jgi:phage-related protein
MIGAWLSGVRDRVAEIWSNIRNAIAERIEAIRQRISVLTWFRNLPGQIVGALGNLGSLLGGVGRDLIVGLWNGLVGMWEWFRNAIYNFFAGIMPQWVKDALGIASPSKVFMRLGRELPAGMALGIERASGLVETAIAGLATTATVGVTGMGGAAFAGGAMPVGGGGVVIQNLNLTFQDDRDMYEKGREFAEGLFEFQRRGGVLPTTS